MVISPFPFFYIPSTFPYIGMVIVPARVLMTLSFYHPRIMLSFWNSTVLIQLHRCYKHRIKLKGGESDVGGEPSAHVVIHLMVVA